MRTTVYLLASLLIMFVVSCSKPDDQDSTNPPNPNPPVVPGFDSSATTVNSTWQCVIDGKSYSGTIDTSFLQMNFRYGADSLIVSTGTSADKKSHIHFKLVIDRTKFPLTGINNNANAGLIFDTSTNKLLFTDGTSAFVNYKIDSISGTNLVISFSGNLYSASPQNRPITGKFSCKLFKGNNQPNKFYCLVDSVKRFGYFTSALMSSNTLIMEGHDYLGNPYQPFRLLIRTGGTIKPGVYRSSNGDCSFGSSSPIGMPSYVDDSLGNLTVTIQSVSGNIVKGTFSGTDQLRYRIDTGSFTSSVTNYIPQQEALDRWKFDAWSDHAFADYHCYAGNITTAIKATINGRNYLTVNGESDNGASVFKIVLSSTSPIARGPYKIHTAPDNVLDTLYFKSGISTWDGTRPYLYSHQGTAPLGGETYCYIESIDNAKVSGTFYGIIFNNLQDVFFGPGSSGAREIRKASFTASF